MAEPTSRVRTADRDFAIWQRYVAGETQMELAAAFELGQSTVSDIIARMKNAIPLEERRARQARQLAELDHMRTAALDLVDADPIPAYSNGRPIMMPDGDGERIAEDHTGRVRAMDMVIKVQEREAKALGLDAPSRVSVEAEQLGAEIMTLLGQAGDGRIGS